MRLPGMHALLTAGIAVLTTAGTVSAVSLTAAGREEPALPPAPPVAPAPPAPAP
ncbi:CoA transferase, partial [Pseudonocardia sp. SID8383]|nr:CoA transferase [Pseudonocardia sp. SID8383]